MSGNDQFVERLVVGLGFATDQASLQQVMGEFRGAFDALTGYAGALLAAAGAGVAFTLVQASAMDEVADLSAQLRTTTEDLTAMQWAALKSGVGAQTLEGALIRLDRSLGEASSGTGPAAEAFATLGLSVYGADGRLRDAVGSISDIAEALARVPDEGRRAQILTDLLGRSAARLRPLMEQGAEGIAMLEEEAHRLGLVLSTESAEAADKLTSSVDGLQAAIRGIRWQIADVLMPPLTRTVEALTAWLIAQDGIVHGGLDRFLRGLSWTIEQLETPTGKAVAGMTVLAGVIGAARGVSAVASAMSAIPVVGELTVGLGSLAATAGPVAAAVLLAALAIDDLVVTAQGGDSALRRLLEALGLWDEATETADATTGLLSEAFGALALTTSLLGDELEKSFPSVAEWEQGFRSLAHSVGLTDEILSGLVETLQSIGDWSWRWNPTRLLVAGADALLPDFPTVAEMKEAQEGFRRYSAFMAGDPSVTLSEEGRASAFGRETAERAGRGGEWGWTDPRTEWEDFRSRQGFMSEWDNVVSAPGRETPLMLSPDMLDLMPGVTVQLGDISVQSGTSRSDVDAAIREAQDHDRARALDELGMQR